jgi:hypothetical protein
MALCVQATGYSGAFLLLGAFEIGWLVLDYSLLTHELEPLLGGRSLLGHNGNQLNALFHIELVLLYRFAIEAIGDLPQSRYWYSYLYLDPHSALTGALSDLVVLYGLLLFSDELKPQAPAAAESQKAESQNR